MNKQGLWFLTLFSLILVLSVYYVTMPNEIFKSAEITTEEKKEEQKEEKENSDANNQENKASTKDETVISQNTNYIETLKVELDSERAEILDTLQAILSDKNKTSEEKNKAYEQMKEINSLKASETAIAKKIKDEYSLNSYVKKEDSKIEVVVEGKDHDVKLANKIMRSVQSSFDEKMSITVKFA